MLEHVAQRITAAVDRERLIDTTFRLCSEYSPTGAAGPVSDLLAEIFQADGFSVERPVGGHPAAPAVAVRFQGPRPGRVLQFDGHLDTVHLPFVPPTIDANRLTGSGASDMKGGIAAAVEAMRALRDCGCLSCGTVLLTAHDLHEAPWGDGSQLDALIGEDYVGDAVLIPEYQTDFLPTVGRGQATWQICIARNGEPVHEVKRPSDEPSVIAAGAELVQRFEQWNTQLAQSSDGLAGAESVFIGQIHSGEIYNQYPQRCRLEGTRRWLPGQAPGRVEQDFRSRVAELAQDTGTNIELKFQLVRDAFQLDLGDPIVAAFQQSRMVLGHKPLPVGGKAFVDDGNTFWARKRVAAITHGPQAGGAHTLQEWVSIDDLVRVANLYALTAAAYCGGELDCDSG